MTSILRTTIAITVALSYMVSSLPANSLETATAISAAIAKKWTGDYDAMLKRRVIRILIPYSKTYFFIDGAKTRGLAVDAIREFEKDILKDVRTKLQKPQIFLIPTRRDRLIPDLTEGKGDLVIANLTITKKRLAQIEFSAPFNRNVSEVLVTPATSASRNGVNDLSGMTIYVRRSSSYHSSLMRLNASFIKSGKQPIVIKSVSEYLEDEDLLEMVNARLLPAIIMDSHKAVFWSKIFKNMRIHKNATVRRNGEIAWAFRKGSPQLKRKVDAFAARAKVGTMLGNMLIRRYFRDTKWLKNANAPGTLDKLRRLSKSFIKYGKQYKIDWLILAALAFKESQFNQSAIGPRGAVGIMQIKPETAASKAVGIPNISSEDANIHAGTKYLRYLGNTFFPGKEVDDFNRIMFALASYNAGPNRIAALRKKAQNPNIWFNSVETVVAKEVNEIPVRYVLNIAQYYEAFRLHFQSTAGRRKEKVKMISK